MRRGRLIRAGARGGILSRNYRNMTMPQKDKIEIEKLERLVTTKNRQIEALQDALREAQAELRHYQVAVSGVKWLWDKATQQTPFQL